MSSIKFLDDIQALFNNYSFNLGPLFLEHAKQLFIILATIQIVWACLILMLSKADLETFFIQFIKKFLIILIFWTILLNSTEWVPAIYNSFEKLGNDVVSLNSYNQFKEIKPSALMKKGIDLGVNIMSVGKKTGWKNTLFSTAIGLATFYIFARVTMEFILIKIGGSLVLSGGIIMLALGGCQAVRSYAEKYLQSAITLGVKLLFILIIVSAGEYVAGELEKILFATTPRTFLNDYLTILGGALIFYYLALHVPALAGNLFSGSFFLGFGHNDMSITNVIAGTGAVAGAIFATTKAGTKIAGGASKLITSGLSYQKTANEINSSPLVSSGNLTKTPGVIKTLGMMGVNRVLKNSKMANIGRMFDAKKQEIIAQSLQAVQKEKIIA